MKYLISKANRQHIAHISALIHKVESETLVFTMRGAVMNRLDHNLLDYSIELINLRITANSLFFTCSLIISIYYFGYIYYELGMFNKQFLLLFLFI